MKKLNYSSLLIVTYGRSGSTLLQGVLNEIDEVFIRGENCNFCYGIYQSYKSLERAKMRAKKAKISSCSPVSPWFGALDYDLDAYKVQQSKTIKQLMLHGTEGVSCYGFKEVRYDSVPAEDFSDYLKFLDCVFPNLGIVFNVRNIDEVLKSGWWKSKKHKETKRLLMETEQRFMEYASSDSNCFVISYSDVVNKTQSLKELYDFIGAEYNEASVNDVLSRPHSYGQSKGVLDKLNQALKGE